MEIMSNNSEDNNITFITNSKTNNKINSYLKLQSRWSLLLTPEKK